MPSNSRLNGGDASQSLIFIISSLIDETGKSKRKIASEMGKSHTYLNDRLNGKVDMTITDLERLCQVLEVDIVLVVAAAEWMTTKERPAILTDREANQIADWFEQAAKAGYDFLAEQEQQAE